MSVSGRFFLILPTILMLGACSTMRPLMFWDGYEFEAQSLEVVELRRALVCETPTEASQLQVFDSLAALQSSAVAQALQVDRLEDLDPLASYIVVEQGQRRTGGYSIELRPEATVDEEGLLTLTADWIEPSADRMQIQILTSLCVLARLPAQPYERVQLLDLAGSTRASWVRSSE